MKTIQPPLLRAPVEAFRPMRTQVADIPGIRAIVPARVLELIRPARMAKASLQVAECLIGNVDLVRLGHSALRRHCETARQRSRVPAWTIHTICDASLKHRTAFTREL